MTARGVEFLNEWVSENVPPLPIKIASSQFILILFKNLMRPK